MEDLNTKVKKHYLKEGLYENIIQRLQEMDIDLKNIKRQDLSPVDEFHIRGAAVSKELANSIELKGFEVLDVGCGIGGPCRMLAEEFNCQATGIDLSAEFIRTATKLSELLNLGSKTKFVQGDALKLPFDDSSFDVVWTQHVQMNIADKKKFYSEIFRVLRKGGYFLFYDILKKGDGEVTYPMPWANDSSISFLLKAAEKQSVLKELGFTKIQTKDQTSAGIDFLQAMFAKLAEFGPPKLGLNVVMGDTTKPKLLNLFNHFKTDKLELRSGVYRK